MENTGCLSVEVYAGLLHKSKGLDVIVKCSAADSGAQFHKDRVAGVADTLLQCFAAVASGFPAGDSGPCHHFISGAIEGVVKRGLVFLQRHGQCHDLEDRPRLIGIGNGLVAPGGLPNLHLPLSIICAGEPAQFRKQRLIRNFARIVEVIGRVGCHSEDFTGVDVHDDGSRPIANLIFVYGVFEVLFNKMLNPFIDGEYKIITVACIDILFVFKGHISALRVFQGDDAPRHSHQNIVVVGLHAFDAFPVDVCKADDMGSKAPIRIISLGVFGQGHAGQLIVGDKLSHLVSLLLLNLTFDHFVVVVGLHFFHEGFLRNSENSGQLRCHKRHGLGVALCN
ncbi:hypothetical protein SDC9_77089 [bioreactor metagenome]|uniref:Uncharacterized protein n=1 Tax=bioreactor metagenome TaxID=1076179 RepID=A0A644YQE4_9ZZZZ